MTSIKSDEPPKRALFEIVVKLSRFPRRYYLKEFTFISVNKGCFNVNIILYLANLNVNWSLLTRSACKYTDRTAGDPSSLRMSIRCTKMYLRLDCGKCLGQYYVPYSIKTIFIKPFSVVPRIQE
ncbi:hypothetical protein CEXT_151931 [Caerostris extrusa]|uniref:Uncharacterized protein n=1 Tax=Caerostris extrusa TaxID=172846 RepID=A0AAV4P0J4_CAEEX|nr:hypothetical protein CEXT_151931 [Caerostris extrusa]